GIPHFLAKGDRPAAGLSPLPAKRGNEECPHFSSDARATLREQSGSTLGRRERQPGLSRFASKSGMSPLPRPNLCGPPHHVLVRRELFDTHWPSRVKAIRRDADLGPHA